VNAIQIVLFVVNAVLHAAQMSRSIIIDHLAGFGTSADILPAVNVLHGIYTLSRRTYNFQQHTLFSKDKKLSQERKAIASRSFVWLFCTEHHYGVAKVNHNSVGPTSYFMQPELDKEFNRLWLSVSMPHRGCFIQKFMK
jgi:hypothetical protein